jgi:hypothetical protein
LRPVLVVEVKRNETLGRRGNRQRCAGPRNSPPPSSAVTCGCHEPFVVPDRSSSISSETIKAESPQT